MRNTHNAADPRLRCPEPRSRAIIVQLAKLLSGFVTGQITVAKVVVTVAAQSLASGKWPAAALELSLSFRSCSCLSGCLWISLLFLIMMPTGDHWFVLGQRIDDQASAIKEHQVSVFSLSDVGDIRVCARLHREPCQASNRFALFHVLPKTELSSHFPFPSHKWNCQIFYRA